MIRLRFLLVGLGLALASIGARGATGHAAAAEWPPDRQFVLAEPAPPLLSVPPPSSVAEDRDGSLLLLLEWPIAKRLPDGSISEQGRTRLMRIARDGTRSFVPPFGQLEPGSRDTRINVDDEILLLPDHSILFTRYNAIDRVRPDGSIVRFAGNGRYFEGPSGDGGPATAANVGFAHGLARFPDGSIVFSDGSGIRRVAPDGIITTIAGPGQDRFGGDGGPASAASLAGPSDVLPTPDGGFLIADTFNGRVRRVNAQGVISTVAGTDNPDIFASSGDGGPATAARLSLPQYLAYLPDGSLLIGGWDRIRKVAPDGTISTIFRVEPVHASRVGDFVGRYGQSIEAMDVTREGGIVVIVASTRLRALYLAPPHTRRTLLALRDARASERSVKVAVDTTAAGRLRLEIRRRGRLVAVATRRVRAGRRVIAVAGRLGAVYHDIRVTVRPDHGGGAQDEVRLFTGRTLPRQLVIPALGSDVRACTRIDKRRIDCETHNPENEESGVPCLNTNAYRLFASGLLFSRPYGPGCHPKPIPFDRTPAWTGPWRPWSRP